MREKFHLRVLRDIQHMGRALLLETVWVQPH